jgi:hypothetical protein
MKLQERLDALVSLGEGLQQQSDLLQAIIQRTHYNNPWFTPENQTAAIKAIASRLLDASLLRDWAAGYGISDEPVGKTVGMVMAGNIPLVGFHDLICAFAAGCRSQIKLSEKDRFLLPYFLKCLEAIHPGSEDYFAVVDSLKGFDAVIATGSNNSARYFEAYFGKYPHIIRRNRNAVAILDGTETLEELAALGQDIFQYFGLGCRNVSKVYVPAGYDFQPLMETLHDFKEVILHHKYKNNFDYNMALVMLNRIPFINNGCIILTESQAIASRIAMLHYEFYNDTSSLAATLQGKSEEIQCIVSHVELPSWDCVGFGKTQEPDLRDYPDRLDVMDFLVGLN